MYCTGINYKIFSYLRLFLRMVPTEDTINTAMKSVCVVGNGVENGGYSLSTIFYYPGQPSPVLSVYTLISASKNQSIFFATLLSPYTTGIGRQ